MSVKVTEFGPTIEPQVFLPEIPRQNLGAINAANVKDSPLFIVYDVNLTSVGQTLTCYSESEVPDFWVCTMLPLVGLRALIYNGPQNSGVPMRLAGGGFLKVPAMNEYFTVVCSAATVTGTVIAVRKYKDVSIVGGQLT